MNKSCELISDEYVHQTIEDRFELMSRIQQIDILCILLKNEKNAIFIIRIEFEKSIIFQITSLMFILIKTALIIMSLNALTHEQCEKLKDISDCKLFILNEDNHSSFNITLIHQESFMHNKSSM
jgi:superfamily II DNA helicase RecQ